MKKILKNLGIAVVVFVLVLLVGILVWEYSSEWRAEKSGEYLAKAEVYVEEGDSLALWEIEKAYWMGMDYPEFRIARAIKLMQLNDIKANEEIEYLLVKNFGNDDFYFLYADRLYQEGKFVDSEKYLLKVGDSLDIKFGEKYNEYLAYFFGLHGDWKSARDYLQKVDSEFANRMKLALLIILDEVKEVDYANKDKELIEKINDLHNVSADIYTLKVADIMVDLDLSAWARTLLENTNWGGEVDRDLYLIYGQSLMMDGDCKEALKYFLEAEKIDSVNKEVHENLMQVYECLGEGEWEEWEGLLSSK